MQNRKQIARLAINRIANGKFVRVMTITILEYVEIDFIKRYPGSHRTINRVRVACHLTIISQNFVECKHNFKKKGLKKTG
jgi:hypothetical protein